MEQRWSTRDRVVSRQTHATALPLPTHLCQTTQAWFAGTTGALTTVSVKQGAREFRLVRLVLARFVRLALTLTSLFVEVTD